MDSGQRRRLPVPGGSARLAWRDAGLATGGVIALIIVGSDFLRQLDTALLGYLGATVAATAGVAYRTSAFWRRPASAFYGRALLAAMRDRRRLRAVLANAQRHLVVQQPIARRSRIKWIAHLLLSLGTLGSFAITVPLVFGWLHFDAIDAVTYRVVFFNLGLHSFAIDGVVGFLIFHALSAGGVAVALGATYFLITRLRRRGEPGALTRFHIAPLLLLLAVALTGLALPASRTLPGAFRVAALAHELTVILLLVALPFSKLSHLFIRPLQLGALVVQDTPSVACLGCGAPLAPAAQLAAVEQLLAARGVAFAEHQRQCPTCRRRLLASAQARLMGADFQPRLTGVRPAPLQPAKAA